MYLRASNQYKTKRTPLNLQFVFKNICLIKKPKKYPFLTKNAQKCAEIALKILKSIQNKKKHPKSKTQKSNNSKIQKLKIQKLKKIQN